MKCCFMSKNNFVAEATFNNLLDNNLLVGYDLLVDYLLRVSFSIKNLADMNKFKINTKLNVFKVNNKCTTTA